MNIINTSKCMHGSRKFSQGGGGVQIPRRGLTVNFNMAKINNVAIPGGGGGSDPLTIILNNTVFFACNGMYVYD